MPRTFDAIVIGTGQSGPPLAARMAKSGMKTAVIERQKFGGTCVNVGCTPTKALVASARAIHMARRGGEFGFTIDGNVRVDFRRLMERKREIVAPSNEGIEKWMKSTDGITVFEGHGAFRSPTTVEVGGETLEAEKIFLDVGARSRTPNFDGADTVPYLTSTGILELEELPDHLIIIGGGYVALEFAQMFRRFGSKVTVVEKHHRLIGREDEQASSVMRELLEGEGIHIRLSAECIGLASDGRSVGVNVQCEDGPPEVRGSHILTAIGRTPNTDDLGLDHAGIETEKDGTIRVDERCRTNVPGIWAIGECNGHGAFTHTSYDDYEIVASDLFDGGKRTLSRRIFCSALYTDPPLARVGMTEAEVRRSGRKVLVAERPMVKVTRAREQGETHGYMKVFIDADSERIMGATIFGHNGDEIVHTFLDVMYADAPYTAIAHAVHIHPTISELIPTMLKGAKPIDGE